MHDALRPPGLHWACGGVICGRGWRAQGPQLLLAGGHQVLQLPEEDGVVAAQVEMQLATILMAGGVKWGEGGVGRVRNLGVCL